MNFWQQSNKKPKMLIPPPSLESIQKPHKSCGHQCCYDIKIAMVKLMLAEMEENNYSRMNGAPLSAFVLFDNDDYYDRNKDVHRGQHFMFGLERGGHYVGKYNLIGGKEDTYRGTFLTCCALRTALRECKEEAKIDLSNHVDGDVKWFFIGHSVVFIVNANGFSAQTVTEKMQEAIQANRPSCETEMSAAEWFNVKGKALRGNGQISSFAQQAIDKYLAM